MDIVLAVDVVGESGLRQKIMFHYLAEYRFSAPNLKQALLDVCFRTI